MNASVKPSIHVGGVDIEYDEPAGMQRWTGSPAVSMWLETSVAGLLSGFQRMVGTERFNLAMHGGGRDGTAGDWAFITSQGKTFEEGFVAWSALAGVAGWGRFEIISIDRHKKEVRFRCHNSWESISQKALKVTWGTSFAAGKLEGICERLFDVPACWAEQTVFAVKGAEYDEFLVKPSDKSLEARVEALLDSDDATKADLAVALEKLRKEVEVRDQTERALREKLDVIARQEEAIKALSAPIIEVWDGILTLPLFGIVDSQRAGETMERLLGAITEKGAAYAIIDLTGVEIVDTSTADHIGRLAKAAELLGTRCIITGIRPAVAHTMVQIGIDLTKLVTLSTLREALQRCMRWKAEENGRDKR
jgi:rsbT co-antagonist protein RsbR